MPCKHHTRKTHALNCPRTRPRGLSCARSRRPWTLAGRNRGELGPIRGKGGRTRTSTGPSRSRSRNSRSSRLARSPRCVRCRTSSSRRRGRLRWKPLPVPRASGPTSASSPLPNRPSLRQSRDRGGEPERPRSVQANFMFRRPENKEAPEVIGPQRLQSGAPVGSRTPNLLIRSQMLYPIELRAREGGVKRITRAAGDKHEVAKNFAASRFWCEGAKRMRPSLSCRWRRWR